MSKRLVPILLLWLSACGDRVDHRLQGYVEGEYVRVAAPVAGRMTSIATRRGADVAMGTPLYTLEAEREQAAVAEATNRLAAARARLADLQKGRRPAELAVIRAQLRQARSQQELAVTQLGRQRELRRQGLASAQQLDEASAQATSAAARVGEIEQQLRVAELAARPDAVAAAIHEVRAAEASLAQTRWQLDQKSAPAPVAGRVEEIYYRVGEWVPAGAVILSLLPPENRKLRFFVSESSLGRLQPGQPVEAACDACGGAIHARISFIAAQAEFTPPVLYGREQRARLVFLVEAVPEAQDALRLHPGQPVDVTLPHG